MNIEIQKPELERRVREGVQSGRFHDVDEFLTKALDALAELHADRVGALDWSQCTAVESVP
jgi:Arc/MetJ-type ribon-helix-helix transcriptional regulator